MDLKRLFIAVDISESVRTGIRSGIYRKIDLGYVSWVRPENLHITLKFLGDTRVSDIRKISDIIDSSTENKSGITLKYTGLGVFPNLSRARVVWVGFEDATGTLEEIARELDCGLHRELGIYRERREFVPHLTVARIKGDLNRRNITGLINNGMSLTEDSFAVSSIALYESSLQPGGAVYTKLHESPLR